MGDHALLSPSAASKWLNCPPSARLEGQFPDTSSVYAEEGTLAHSLGELYVLSKLNLLRKVNAFAPHQSHNLYSEELRQHAENYALFVIERFEEAKKHTKDARLFLEEKIDLSAYAPESFGTSDAVIIADGTLDVIDLKYGKGVPVSAEGNKQMKMYGLGAYEAFGILFDIHTVRMTIYQPRIDNYSSWEIQVEDLQAWAEAELKPKAQQAFKGEGDFKPGAHCRFCKAKAVCKAHADMNMEVAKYDFRNVQLLEEHEVADILGRADAFKNWITAVEEHALNEAVNSGKEWPGFKLVEGRSVRKYQDESLVANKLLSAGFAEDLIYDRSVKGITAMEKAIGKKEFGLYLNDLIIKPQGKPTLVPVSDKRPAYNSTDSAVKDFSI